MLLVSLVATFSVKSIPLPHIARSSPGRSTCWHGHALHQTPCTCCRFLWLPAPGNSNWELRKDSLWEKPQTNCLALLGWLCGSQGILQLPPSPLAARCAAGAPKGAGTSTVPWLPASISPCNVSVSPYSSLYCNNINPLPIFLADQCSQMCRYNIDNLKVVKTTLRHIRRPSLTGPEPRQSLDKI